MSFVLVHGAGMGASCWDRLVPRLTGRVVAVDLPGRGERADIDLRTVTLEDCADAIVADVEREDVTDIVLVAHSFAGVSVPRVLDRLQDRVRHVVFLAAVVPPDGTAVIDGIDPAVRDIVKASIVDGRYVRARGTGHVIATTWTTSRPRGLSSSSSTTPARCSPRPSISPASGSTSPHLHPDGEGHVLPAGTAGSLVRTGPRRSWVGARRAHGLRTHADDQRPRPPRNAARLLSAD